MLRGTARRAARTLGTSTLGNSLVTPIARPLVFSPYREGERSFSSYYSHQNKNNDNDGFFAKAAFVGVVCTGLYLWSKYDDGKIKKVLTDHFSKIGLSENEQKAIFAIMKLRGYGSLTRLRNYFESKDTDEEAFKAFMKDVFRSDPNYFGSPFYGNLDREGRKEYLEAGKLIFDIQDQNLSEALYNGIARSCYNLYIKRITQLEMTINDITHRMPRI